MNHPVFVLGLVSYNFCMIPLVCSLNFGYSDPVDRGDPHLISQYPSSTGGKWNVKQRGRQCRQCRQAGTGESDLYLTDIEATNETNNQQWCFFSNRTLIYWFVILSGVFAGWVSLCLPAAEYLLWLCRGDKIYTWTFPDYFSRQHLWGMRGAGRHCAGGGHGEMRGAQQVLTTPHQPQPPWSQLSYVSWTILLKWSRM